MYRTNFGIGHSLKEILDAHRPPGGRLGAGHRGLFETITNRCSIFIDNYVLLFILLIFFQLSLEF